MARRKETPEQERERVYREEQKNNPAGNFNDNLIRTQEAIGKIIQEEKIEELGSVKEILNKYT